MVKQMPVAEFNYLSAGLGLIVLIFFVVPLIMWFRMYLMRRELKRTTYLDRDRDWGNG